MSDSAPQQRREGASMTELIEAMKQIKVAQQDGRLNSTQAFLVGMLANVRDWERLRLSEGSKPLHELTIAELIEVGMSLPKGISAETAPFVLPIGEFQ
jgi:hypothetical protein